MAEERGKQYGQLVAKAWSDEGFKARLLANPKAAMAEVGMDAPEGVEIEVVESTQEKAYLVIPPKPDGELSDEDLDKVAGGGKDCAGLTFQYVCFWLSGGHGQVGHDHKPGDERKR